MKASHLLAVALIAGGCQEYAFVFKADENRLGAHFRFTVEQPSQADILFVVDNSASMYEEQQTLAASVSNLLAALAPLDTSYRIGITSTDAWGFRDDCNGTSFFDVSEVDPAYVPAARGNCGDPSIKLRYPHDGARGRLIAAFDARYFDAGGLGSDGQPLYPELDNDDERSAFLAAAPTSVSDGPLGADGQKGARWVIDRDQVQKDACLGCGLPDCKAVNDAGEPEPLWDGCARDVAIALVKAYIRSNVAGLGVQGSGYEAGLLAGTWAVGVDPEETDDNYAVRPNYDLTARGEPNTYDVRGVNGVVDNASWTRPEAVLAVMIVSDEQDCSMPYEVYRSIHNSEDPGLPAGSACYMEGPQSLFFRTERLANLLKLKKTSSSRVASCFIGGLLQTGTIAGREGRDAAPHDCMSTTYAPMVEETALGYPQPDTNCSCLRGAPPADYENWCLFTQIQGPTTPPTPPCDALAGSRYIDFASQFGRRTFDSVCRASKECGIYTTEADCVARACAWSASDSACLNAGYGDSLAACARIATLACFDIDAKVKPAGDALTGAPSTANITVYRTPHADATAGLPPTKLAEVDATADEVGWSYDPVDNRICLSGIDRLVGDVYDIFILTRDEEYRDR